MYINAFDTYSQDVGGAGIHGIYDSSPVVPGLGRQPRGNHVGA